MLQRSARLAGLCDVPACGCHQAVHAACFVQVLSISGEEVNSINTVNLGSSFCDSGSAWIMLFSTVNIVMVNFGCQKEKQCYKFQNQDVVFHSSVKYCLFALYDHNFKLNLLLVVQHCRPGSFIPSRSTHLVRFSLFDSEQNINGVNITNNYAV